MTFKKWLPAVLALGLGILIGVGILHLRHEDPILESQTLLKWVPSAPTEQSSLPADAGRPRNLVLLIGDGLGLAHLAAARDLLHGPNGRLAVESFPVTGWAYTHSMRDLYTDSGAGATAIAIGAKTYPGAVGVDVDGAPRQTLFEAARDAGKAVGVLTDSAFFDATPAAFLAHRETRRETFGVIEDMAASGAALILGESRKRLEEHEKWPATRSHLEGRGFTLARTFEELQAAEGPVLSLFPTESIGDRGREPHLPQLAEWALDRLAEQEGGFVLLIETEETDTASHEGDLERTVRGVEALDQVASHLVERFSSTGDTLVVVTADHETGGLTLFNGGEGDPLRHRWSTSGHTAVPVPVLAWGPGSGAFAGVHDNTDVGRLLAEALGLGCCGASAPEPAVAAPEPAEIETTTADGDS